MDYEKRRNVELVAELKALRSQVDALREEKARQEQSEEILRARMRLIEFAMTHSLEELLQKTLDEVGTLTDSPIGFYHFVDADQKRLSLQAWSTRTVQEFCKAEGKELHYSINDAGVWVDCVHKREPVIHNDYASLPHRKGLPPGHAAVIRELVVPIFRGDRIVAILGIGNKPQNYTERDIEIVSLFADLAWDIAEHKQAEETLRKIEASLAEAQRVAHIGSWELNLQKNELWWSNEVYRIFGVKPQEFGATYEAFLSFVHPDDRKMVDEAYRTAIEKKTQYDVVHRIVRRDGEVRYVHERSEDIVDETGKVVRSIGTVHDITEQKQLETRLLQAQKMEALGRFVGGIAHDFNNLLVVIGGRARRVLKRLKEDDPLRKEIEEALRAEESASSLTRQLLAFGRKQILQPVMLNLNEIISDMEMMLRRLLHEDIVLLTRTGQNLGFVEADPTQIEQILMNLVVNARDAMPDGGTLTIETSNVFLGEKPAEGYVAAPGHYVMLAVSDTGCGMDSETLSHIFEPFFTTKPPGEGTGLGLSTVYGIVRQSGGDIRVYSEPGKGTTFKIYLPRVKEPTEAHRREGQGEADTLKGSETILLVENEDSVREMIALELNDMGYTVLEASSSSEALRIFERHDAQIHIVVTDVVMPGMSGPELCRTLTERNPGLKTLLMTGYSEEAAAQKGSIKGKPLLQKPFTPETLARKVREVIGEP
jgi:PAS domain S-box-containing protein